jgi:hypothetical protein
MHDPGDFNFVVEAAIKKALHARAYKSQHKRNPPPCCYYTEAGLPMADRLKSHHDFPLPLQPSQQQRREHKSQHQQYQHQQYAPHPTDLRGRGRGPRGRGGRWGRGGRGAVAPHHVLHLLDNPPCPLLMWICLARTLHQRSQPSCFSSISMGLPLSIWPTVSVMITDPPFCRRDNMLTYAWYQVTTTCLK